MRTLLFLFLTAAMMATQAPATKAFSDVPPASPSSDAVADLSARGVITGHADGTFRPALTVNRAELLVLAYRAKGIMLPAVLPKRCFADVDPAAWYASVVCAAKSAGHVSGYTDGTFRPANPVTLAEAARIVVAVFGMNTAAQPGDPWYAPALRALSQRNAIPADFATVVQPVTRLQMAELLYRIVADRRDREAVPYENLSVRACQVLGDEADPRFDAARVRAVWVGWMNEVRAAEGLPAYVENRQLDRTAVSWARAMRDAGAITHRRSPSDAEYDYPRIAAWLSQRGIVAERRADATFAETVGWSVLACSETDCTDELLVPLRAIFDLYLAEKGQVPKTFARSHYESVTSPDFTQIGMGYALSGNKVYVATHYVTAIASDPDPVCR